MFKRIPLLIEFLLHAIAGFIALMAGCLLILYIFLFFLDKSEFLQYQYLRMLEKHISISNTSGDTSYRIYPDKYYTKEKMQEIQELKALLEK